MARKLKPEEAGVFNDRSGEMQAFEFESEYFLGELTRHCEEPLDPWTESDGWFVGKLFRSGGS